MHAFPAYMSVHCMHNALRGQDVGLGSQRAGVVDSFKMPCGCWKLNLWKSRGALNH